MILQRDKRAIKEIQEYGCYYMSLLYFANKYTNCQLGFPFINELYDISKKLDYISEANLVKFPDRILRKLGLLTVYLGHLPASYVCKPDEFEILHFKWIDKKGVEHHHFVAGDGKGHVTYDPWGFSATVANGELHNKRIFRVLSWKRF